ncbi:hypothetical protein BH20ACI1_BH20ACI1_20890 [soil metagenome]
MTKKNLVDTLRVTSPCSQDWNSMKGNDKVRFCEHCDLSVNNLSEMTRKEALRVVRQSEGGICVRYIKNPRTNAPVFADKLHQIARRAGVAASVLSASLAVSTVAYAQGGISIDRNLSEKSDIVQDKIVKTKETKTAVISGTVTDPNGAVIPAASVSLINEKTNENRTAATNENGFYEFKDVTTGNYKINFQSSYFKNAEINGIKVEVGSDIRKDASLEVDGEIAIAGGAMFIDYEQPLLRAVSNEEIDEVKLLLAKGANVNAKDKVYGGITALFVAVEDGNIKMVGTLLDFGAKVNARDDEKRTPLMNLDDDATPELVNLLISYGAKINAVDKEGNSALIVSANRVDAKVLQFLLNHGAKVNAQNKDGQTALMNAAEDDNLENVKVLLAAGADVNLKNSDGETARSLTSDDEIEKLLEIYGASTEF